MDEITVPYDRLFGVNIRDAGNRVKIDEAQFSYNMWPLEDGEYQSIRKDWVYASDSLTCSGVKSRLGVVESIGGIDYDVALFHCKATDQILTLVDSTTPTINAIVVTTTGAIGSHDSSMSRIDETIIFTCDNATLSTTTVTYPNRLFRKKAAATVTSIYSEETLSLGAPNFTAGQLSHAVGTNASYNVFGKVRYQWVYIRKESDGTVSKIGPPMPDYLELDTGINSDELLGRPQISGFTNASDQAAQGYTHMRTFRTVNIDSSYEKSGGSAGSPLVFHDMSIGGLIADIPVASIASTTINDNNADVLVGVILQILETQGTAVIPACRGNVFAFGRMWYFGDPNQKSRLYYTAQAANNVPAMRGLYSVTGTAFLKYKDDETGKEMTVDIGGYIDVDTGDGLGLSHVSVEGVNLLICKESKSYLLQDGDPIFNPKPISTHIGVGWTRLSVDRLGINYYATNKGLRPFDGTQWGDDLTNSIKALYDQFINAKATANSIYPSAYFKWMVYNEEFDVILITGPNSSQSDYSAFGPTDSLSSSRLSIGVRFLQDGSAHAFIHQPASADGSVQLWRGIVTLQRSRKNIGIYNTPSGATNSYNRFLGGTLYHGALFQIKTYSSKAVGKIMWPLGLELEAVTSTVFTIGFYADGASSAYSRRIDPSNPDDNVWKRRGVNSNYWFITGGKAAAGKDIKVEFQTTGGTPFTFRRLDMKAMV